MPGGIAIRDLGNGTCKYLGVLKFDKKIKMKRI